MIVPSGKNVRILVVDNWWKRALCSAVIAYHYHLVVWTTRCLDIVDARHETPCVIVCIRIVRRLRRGPVVLSILVLATVLMLLSVHFLLISKCPMVIHDLQAVFWELTVSHENYD